MPIPQLGAVILVAGEAWWVWDVLHSTLGTWGLEMPVVTGR